MVLFWRVLIFLLGTTVGSFLNCVIYRTERDESFLKGRSYCPRCRHLLEWKDLVPVASFLFLRGRCRHCSQKISWQYPLVEISTGLIFLLIFNFQLSILNQFSIIQFSNLIHLLFLFYIASAPIVIFVYDLKHYLIPDKILFPAIAIAFSYRLFENLSHWILIDNWSLKIENFYHIVGFSFAALIASGFFLAIFLISRGKWMGFGDVKLAILLGLILGFPDILIGLFLSFFFGAIIGLGLVAFGGKHIKSEVPFAPFLIAGTFAAMFFGEEIVKWYLNAVQIV